MGFLDNIFKIVESGGVEKALGQHMDKVEKVLNSTLDTAEHGLKKVENVATKTGNVIDVVARKLPSESAKSPKEPAE